MSLILEKGVVDAPIDIMNTQAPVEHTPIPSTAMVVPTFRGPHVADRDPFVPVSSFDHDTASTSTQQPFIAFHVSVLLLLSTIFSCVPLLSSWPSDCDPGKCASRDRQSLRPELRSSFSTMSTFLIWANFFSIFLSQRTMSIYLMAPPRRSSRPRDGPQHRIIAHAHGGSRFETGTLNCARSLLGIMG